MSVWLSQVTHHGVCFARASLSVGEDAGVVALEGVVQDAASDALKDGVLAGVVVVAGVDGVEAVVERERFRRFPAGRKKILFIASTTWQF